MLFSKYVYLRIFKHYWCLNLTKKEVDNGYHSSVNDSCDKVQLSNHAKFLMSYFTVCQIYNVRNTFSTE